MTSPLRVLLTGGSGFVGQAIVQAIKEQQPQWSVYVLDRVQSDIVPADRFLKCDITDAQGLLDAFRRVSPQVIIHTAGLLSHGSARYDKSERNRELLAKVNIEGTRNVIHVARDVGCRALVYTSSWSVVTDDLEHDYPYMNESVPIGNASTCYGWSKTEAEKLVLAANSDAISTCALRPAVIIGQDIVAALHACIARKETAYKLGDCNNLTEPVCVGNVADAHILAAQNLLSDTKTAAGKAFFITNDEPIYFRDLMLAVWAHFGHVPPLEIGIPAWLASSLGLACEWLGWVTGIEGSLNRGSVLDAVGVRYADISLAKDVLGYKPRVSIVDGLERACELYKLVLNKGVKGDEAVNE